MLKEQIALARRRLAAAQQNPDTKKNTYAVVPYLGKNGTRRRPIYIECRGDGVIIQPEGIRLTEEDFQGPMGPGNPLAAALRAAREHLAAQQKTSGGPIEEPYPLLLVRPDGIAAYYCRPRR